MRDRRPGDDGDRRQGVGVEAHGYPTPTGRRGAPNAVDVPAMPEQSHREEMSAAIRAQRERRAAPRSIAPEPAPEQRAEPEPEADADSGTRAEGLFGRRRDK